MGMAPGATQICEEINRNVYNQYKKDSIHIVGSSNGADQENNATKARSPREVVAQAMHSRIREVNQDTCDAGEEDAFFVADLGEVYRQHQRWKRNLGQVKPHYAVKCNPDPQVIRLLAELGTGFDCASKAEIEQVLNLGVDPSRIIYAQPCKTKSFIRFAAQQGVRQMTFDNADELYKVKQFCPDAQLFLRILTDDSASLCRLSLKFGADSESTQGLLELARRLDLNVMGVAFHVGSGASDPAAFRRAVDDARAVFDQARTLGFEMTTLDVGGGFVSDTFESMASVLSDALEQRFPPSVRIIGEPGRFYVAGAYRIACSIIARRTVEDPASDTTSYMLYLNDGVYGNFSSIMFDHQHPVPQILRCADTKASPSLQRWGSPTYNAVQPARHDRPPVQYSIWGPTCDGIDCIAEEKFFPAVLDVGDWLLFEDMGAYTKCSATRFNGFTDTHDTVYVVTEPGARAVLGL